MAQPFRVVDGDDPGRDWGGWDEGGNVDLPGVLTVDTIRGSGSSTPELTTVTFRAQVEFLAAVAFTATVLNLTGAAASDLVLTVRVDGDTEPQLDITANGRLEWGSGSAPVDVNLFRDGSNRLHTTNTMVSEGSFVCEVAGGGLNIKEGANARSGVATLVAGAATVATTAVTANSRILLTVQSLGTVAVPQAVGVTAKTAATSFVITSADATDTSVVYWQIVEPA